MNITSSTLARGTSVLALALAAFWQSSAASAQEAAPAAATAPAQEAAPAAAAVSEAVRSGDEIIVTGSRLGQTGYDAPTPVNVIGEERLRALGIPNVADALNQIPSFRAIGTPASNFFRATGNIGSRTLDLRGLGATRTLTLIDGRRFVGSADNGTVDINSIPSIMVKRTEVVTGGASAAYGANAVAGVVNLILDNKLTGIKTDFNYGISERGDARNFYGAIAGGTDFGSGRGHIVAGVEFAKEYGLGACETRAFCNKYTNYVSNPGYNNATRTSTNGLPATLVLDNVSSVYSDGGILVSVVKPGATPGSTITLGQQVLNVGATSLPAALRGKQFDGSGNLVPYTFGNYLSGVLQQLRDPSQPFNLGLGQQPLTVPVKHLSAMAHADYDLTDTITASAEILYSHVRGGDTHGSYPLDTAVIDINNPYISPTARAAILAADPAITKLNVNSAAYDAPIQNISHSTVNTYRGVLGLKGELFEGWNWDSSYTYGRVNSDLLVRGSRLKAFTDALDVVAAPAGLPGVATGTPICRSSATVATANNGCIPVNLFGPNSINPAAIAKYIQNETQTRRYVQQAAALNLRGAPLQTWAGDLKLAVGGEWRRDTAVGGAGANTVAGNFTAPQTSVLPFTKTTVLEGYLEVSVPLLKDSAIGKSLDVDGAVRRSHYDPFGNATTWKVGGVYSVIDDLTFRVTKSRDVRAPSAAESTPNSIQTSLPLPDPFAGGTHNVLVTTGGNPDLKLEKGDTFTAGVVLKPSFVPRFNMSVDYYNIKVKGAIDSLTATAIANACNVQNLLCDLISFTGAPKASTINTVLSNFQNLSRLHAEGYELVMDWRVPVFSGNLAFQVNANYIVDLSTVSATGVATQLDNWTGNNGSVTNIQGVPRYKLDGVMTYSRDLWSLTAHGRYIPRALLDPTKIGPEQKGYDVNLPNSQSINHVSARFYLDLSGTIRVMGTDQKGGVELYGSVSNVFDKSEPKQLRTIGNPLQFDPVGRAFRVGVRSSW